MRRKPGTATNSRLWNYTLAEKQGFEPSFPFGYGLSYTSFKYSNLRLAATQIVPDGELAVSADVTNTGPRSGEEAVQLYVGFPNAKVDRPVARHAPRTCCKPISESRAVSPELVPSLSCDLHSRGLEIVKLSLQPRSIPLQAYQPGRKSPTYVRRKIGLHLCLCVGNGGVKFRNSIFEILYCHFLSYFGTGAQSFALEAASAAALTFASELP